jgi:hypothetical protein
MLRNRQRSHCHRSRRCAEPIPTRLNDWTIGEIRIAAFGRNITNTGCTGGKHLVRCAGRPAVHDIIAVSRMPVALTSKFRRSGGISIVEPQQKVLPDAALPEPGHLGPRSRHHPVEIQGREIEAMQSGACGSPPRRAYRALPEMWPSG